MAEKKKILVFHHSGAIGGGGVAMLNILGALKEMGHELEVVCPKEPSYMLDEIESMGIKTDGVFDTNWCYPHFNGQHYSAIDPRYTRRWRHIKNSKGTVRKIIADKSPDIVIFNSMTIAWMGECVPEGTKTICFDRETFPMNGKDTRSKRIKGWLYGMTKSVFLSEYDKAEAGGCDSFTVITDKVDIAKFVETPDDFKAKCSRQLDFDKRSILYTGGMWEVKGAHTALSMMHHLNDDYQLIFLQYTPPKSRPSDMKAKIRSILGMDYEGETLKLLDGIEDRVKFFPPQKEMPPIYVAADIVIFPSCEPHQAMPVYEAGASCKPCVISDFPNTREFAKDGVNVLTFKPGDAKALADCVDRLCDNELYYKLSDNGHEMCVKNHDINTLKDEIKSLIESIED